MEVYAGWALIAAAIATSIDAAAAGITIPLLGQPIAVACAVIGGGACLLSTAGVLLGEACGVLIGQRAEIVGSGVLIGLGCHRQILSAYGGLECRA